MPEDETMDTDNTKYKDGVNKNARLIVRNISFKATEDSLRDHFSSYGTVEEVKLLRKPDGKLVGSGFVHFTHVPMANKALTATNKKPFMGRPIFVSWAVPKHKYVQEENKVKQEPKLDSTPSQDFEEVKREILMPEEEEKHKIQRINRNARLIVRNISFKATEESLKEHFEPYGTVQEVKLLKKPDGKLVGCAFVHFKNVPMAKKALLNTNMKPFLGRPISVDWAVAKDKYMQHVVSQQIEMEEKIKKEESDSEEDDTPLNISNEELKQEVKSESDDGSDDSDDEDEKSDEDSEEDDEVDEDNESNDEDIDEDEEMDDDKSVTSAVAEKKRIQLNDAEDGLTVFLSNVPFSVDDEQLRQFAEQTGPVKYALICVDKLTEHSKGSGFVKFVNQADAEKFLSLPVEQLRLEGQVVQVKPALKRENLQKGSKKQPKDNRNLYLVKEGVVVAGTRAAVGVSASDMAKRLTLERSKTQMLKNLNR
ncbi:RNA-binding protein 28 [Papilio machaon]|uniref:RNA-binding protein 28 n=1 Tax=Papilio machaon TaxID=76193 RepID=A0A0N1PFF6_PAPMA|nr:RNA-binding protein 28 [Papilio machaon]